MFGKAKLQALETQLTAARDKMEAALKDKEDLLRQLNQAKAKISEQEEAARKEKEDLLSQLDQAQARISDLEKQVAESELTDLKKQARQTIVEYEGLKDLYARKNREIDETRESVEEGFAREAATKRNDLAEEIKTNRDNNREMVAETTSTFAGSYLYYLDQIRMMMDALNQAAQDTGKTLYDGDIGNIRERFGAKILEHLRSDREALPQNTGDRVLIGAEDLPAEEPDAPCCECGDEPAAESAEVPAAAVSAVQSALEASKAVAEKAAEIAKDTAAEAKEAAAGAASGLKDAAEATAETAAEFAKDAAAKAKEAAAGAVSGLKDAAAATAETAAEIAKNAAAEAKEAAAGAVSSLKEAAAAVAEKAAEFTKNAENPETKEEDDEPLYTEDEDK